MMQGMKTCQCGCGQAITPKRWHKYTNARFISGHHVKLAASQGRPQKKAYIPTPEETPSGVCECGCGKPTGISPDTWRKERHFKGYPLPFLPGHAPRKRGAASHKWKGGLHINSSGYIAVYAPEHPRANLRGYVHEHRLVMEQFLGRPLTRTEYVHHINEDRTDNRIENLVVLSRGEHSRVHDKAGRMRDHLTPDILRAAGLKGATARWNKPSAISD